METTDLREPVIEPTDLRSLFTSRFPDLTDDQCRQLILLFSPEGRRRARLEEIKASQPDCVGEIYQGHLIEIKLMSEHLMYGRLQVVVHTPDGQILRPILHSKTGNYFKPNPKNPQSTVDWLIKRTKKFIDKCVKEGVYTHCF